MDNALNSNNEIFNSVIEKLKIFYGLKSDRKLAQKLDVLPASFSNSKKRGLLPYEKIISAALTDKISLDDIFGNVINISNKSYSNDKTSFNKNGLVDIALLNDESDSIRIPLVVSGDAINLKGFVSNNFTYIVNTNEIKPEHNRTYLLKSNDIYYIKHISIDLTGLYILRDEDGTVSNINKSELDNVLFIGRIDHKFDRTTLA